METITTLLSQQHHDCDKLFAQAEESVATTQWECASVDFDRFRAAMEQHFIREEQILFPQVENHMGHTEGPTAVMRMEHQQMRQIFTEMAACIAHLDQEQYLGLAETLLILMQQHNAKEEQILYPMSDNLLNHQLPSLLEQLHQLGNNKA
ncbi:MAG: hemerythrin domain-containing protein [Thioploca sp.]|nr:hemerythrin domain-containing protein [Thioploca sp.]